MRRIRVLFVAGLDPVPGGACGGQLTQARGLLHSGLRDVVELVPLSSTMTRIPPPPLIVRMAGAARRLARFIGELRRVDVVLVFVSDGPSLLEKGLMCMVARALGRGVVVRFSSGHLARQCEASRLMTRWLRWTLASCHVTTTQGSFWTRYFERFPEAAGKIMEAGNGVALPPVTAARKPAGKRVIFVGWVQREKGVFEALDAFAAVSRRHPDATFTMIGGGRDHAAVLDAVAAMNLADRVQAPGWRPPEEIPAALAGADVLLLPSHAEGLPNVVLEAMAAGLPVVATAVGSIPDVIEHERSGLLVQVGNVAGIAVALNRLFDQPELGPELGKTGRRIVEERYSRERVWRIYARAVQKALAESRHSIHVTAGQPASDAPPR